MVRIGEINGMAMPMREMAKPASVQLGSDAVAASVRPDSAYASQVRVQLTNDGRQVDPDEVVHAIDELNKSIQSINECLQFRVHEATNVIMVKVINTETNEVIKEIPPEKFLDLVAKLQELVGIMIDHKI